MFFERTLIRGALIAALGLPVLSSAIPTIDPGAANQLTVTDATGTTILFSMSVPEGALETVTIPVIPVIPVPPVLAPGSYFAWLLDPGTLETSDQIVADVSLTGLTTVTLVSDPLTSPCPGATSPKCLVEDGTLQDMNAALFGIVDLPFKVFAFSELDRVVSEPSPLALLGAALGALGLVRAGIKRLSGEEKSARLFWRR